MLIGRGRRAVATAWSMALCLTGCQTAGPSSIVRGRPDYNSAIHATSAEMTLANIVRVHNGEMPLVMDVSQVLASVQVQASLSPSIAGIGGLNALQGAGAAVTTGATTSGTTGALSSRVVDSRTEGLSAGFQYQESPAVTYTPLSGQALISQISAPIPIPVLSALTESQWSVPSLFSLTINYVTPNTLDHYAIMNALFELFSYGAVGFGSISPPPADSDKAPAAPKPYISQSTTIFGPKTSTVQNGVAQNGGGQNNDIKNSLAIFYEPHHAEDPYSDDLDSAKAAENRIYETKRRSVNLWNRVVLLYDATITINYPNGGDSISKILKDTDDCENQDDQKRTQSSCLDQIIARQPHAIYLSADVSKDNKEGQKSWATDAPIVGMQSALGVLKSATEGPPHSMILFLPSDNFERIISDAPRTETSLESACGTESPATAVSPGNEYYEVKDNFEPDQQKFTFDEFARSQSADSHPAPKGSIVDNAPNLSDLENDAIADPKQIVGVLEEEREIYKHRRLILIIVSKKPLAEELPDECAFVSYYSGRRWYSISNRDTISKRNFSLIAELLSVMAIAPQTSPPTQSVSVGAH